MISFRHHAVSLVAVFLALAVGVFLGSGFLSEKLTDQAAKDELAMARSEFEKTKGQLNSANSFIEAVDSRVVGAALKDIAIGIITLPGVNNNDVDALTGLVGAAGGRVSTRIALTANTIDGAQAVALASIIDNSLPSGSTLNPQLTEASARLGDLLGVLLLPSTIDASSKTALQTLRQGGFIEYADAAVGSAQLTIVLGGGAIPENGGVRAENIASFVAALGSRTTTTTFAGASGSSKGGSPIALLRSNPSRSGVLSTIDNFDSAGGRVAVILAAAATKNKKYGSYGTGPGATALIP